MNERADMHDWHYPDCPAGRPAGECWCDEIEQVEIEQAAYAEEVDDRYMAMLEDSK